MRLMLVTGSYPPMRCGVGDYTGQLARSLAAISGNSVALLTSAGCAPSIGELPRVEIFPVMRGWCISEWRMASAVMRQWKPDIVHVQYPTQGYGRGRLPAILPLMGKMSGARVVQTWHEPIPLAHAVGMLARWACPGPVVVVRPHYLDLVHPVLRSLIAKRLRLIPSASAIPSAQLTSLQRHELRHRYLRGQQRLIVFFGFLYRHKGVDLLFRIANPATDQLVIVGDSDHVDYKADLQRAAGAAAWNGKATLTGFMPENDVAELLSVADAVVLPFRSGGGEWNTSIHGAVANGAYVVTTSTTRHGYDPRTHIHYAGVDAIDEMRKALLSIPQPQTTRAPVCGWGEIGAAHMNLYNPDAAPRPKQP